MIFDITRAGREGYLSGVIPKAIVGDGTVAWLIMAVMGSSSAERWSWPDRQQEAGSVRIDTKVSFADSPDERYNQGGNQNIQSDEIPFRQPTNTAGFYNRPPGEGRYPMHVDPPRGSKSERYRARPGINYPVNIGGQNNIENQVSDGTLDSLQYCKCVSTLNCRPVADNQQACSSNQYLCCYSAPSSQQQNSEFFNEVDDERPALLPSYTDVEGPFPPPPDGANVKPNDGRRQTQPAVLVGPEGPTGNFRIPNNQVLVGPGGPTGSIGPGQNNNVLVGPEGPTGIIGPNNINRNPGVLVGPSGPSDIRQSESAQRGVLVGPGGPTGIIGPQFNRPVLIGPGGPTGIIGPRQQGGFGSQRRGVLVGPGGPTGIVGPTGFNQRRNPGVLVGPGGPTGIIGPGRQILVGPGGPTGQIGPRGSGFGCSRRHKARVPKNSTRSNSPARARHNNKYFSGGVKLMDEKRWLGARTTHGFL